MIRIFRASESADLSEEVMERDRNGEVDTQGIRKAFDAGLSDCGVVKLLFEDKNSEMSLTYAWFKPHYKLPRHQHNADCLYYIVSGDLMFGRHVLGAGDGFLVPKDSQYRYEVGASGVEILEFRTATRFNIAYGNSEASWDRFAEHISTHRESWLNVPPPLAARKIMHIEEHEADRATI